MTRTEIIAQLEAEISLLQRAREILTAPLSDFRDVPVRKPRTKVAAKNRKQPAQVTVLSSNDAPALVAAAPPPQPKPEPLVRRVPPKRRMERRQLSSDKVGKSPAALSGMVPAGPVAVSADEARKVQERSVPPAPAAPEVRPELGAERTLGSLIQAFERRSGTNGIETPRS